MEIVLSVIGLLYIVIVSFLYGKEKQINKQQKENLQTGEKIDKIISNNANISNDDWNSWLQERRNKQK